MGSWARSSDWATQTPTRNPLLTTYWTMAAVRHGDYVAKLRVAPDAESATHVSHSTLYLTSGPEVFRPTLTEELQAQAFDFDLQVQLCTDLNAMPVNDTTIKWPESFPPSSPSDVCIYRAKTSPIRQVQRRGESVIGQAAEPSHSSG